MHINFHVNRSTGTIFLRFSKMRKNNKQITRGNGFMGVRYRTLNLRRRHNSDRNVGIDPNLFQVTFNNKMNERNRTKEMYDN